MNAEEEFEEEDLKARPRRPVNKTEPTGFDFLSMLGKDKKDGPSIIDVAILNLMDSREARESRADAREARSAEFYDMLKLRMLETKETRTDRNDTLDEKLKALGLKMKDMPANDQKTFLSEVFDDIEGQVKDIVVKSFFKGEGEVSKHEYLKIIDKVLDTVKEIFLKIPPMGETPDETVPKTFDVDPEEEEEAEVESPPPVPPAASVVDFEPSQELPPEVQEVLSRVPDTKGVLNRIPAESPPIMEVEEMEEIEDIVHVEDHLERSPEGELIVKTRTYTGPEEPEEPEEVEPTKEEPPEEPETELVEEEVPSEETEEEIKEKPKRGRGRPPKAKKTEG